MTEHTTQKTTWTKHTKKDSTTDTAWLLINRPTFNFAIQSVGKEIQHILSKEFTHKTDDRNMRQKQSYSGLHTKTRESQRHTTGTPLLADAHRRARQNLNHQQHQK